jgi:hypothetical protein
MIYISPFHILERGKELWGHLKQLIKGWSLIGLPTMEEKREGKRERRNGITLTPLDCMDLMGMSIRVFEGKEMT